MVSKSVPRVFVLSSAMKYLSPGVVSIPLVRLVQTLEFYLIGFRIDPFYGLFGLRSECVYNLDSCRGYS